MKRCPLCKNTFSDEANFCPSDAGRLVVVSSEAAPIAGVPSLELPTMQAKLLGGRFHLGPQLGGQATGEVFAADDATTSAQCVVKIVAPAVFPTPLAQQRTERELKQLQKVTNDRVARILDVGKQDNRLWVAMELVSGVPLAEIVQANGPMPVTKAIRIAIDVGEALAEAAKLGVIHRDVSPKNILVEDDRIKVLNFSLPVPVTDKVLGVPEFLSPEQAEGKPVDQRSNIYSLGALLYFMTTGETVFSGETDTVLKQQVSATPPPPSTRTPGAPVPPELEKIILKALEKQSSRRHLTLRQLLGELEQLSSAVLSGKVQAPAPRVTTPPKAAVEAPRPEPAPKTPTAPPVMPVAAKEPSNPVRIPAGETLVGVVVPKVKQAAMIVEAAPEPAAPTAAAAIAPTQPAVVEPPKAVEAPKIIEPPPKVEPAKVEPPKQAVTAAATPAAKLNGTGGAQAIAGRPSGKRGRAAEPAPSGRRKGKFRETLWFKKGELDEVAAKEAAGKDPNAASDKADEMPIEDRYKDDGTQVSAKDAERLSLRTGGTQMMPVVKETQRPVVPGERMAEDELVQELSAGRGKVIAAIVAGVILIGLIVVYFVFIKKPDKPVTGTGTTPPTAPSTSR